MTKRVLLLAFVVPVACISYYQADSICFLEPTPAVLSPYAPHAPYFGVRADYDALKEYYAFPEVPDHIDNGRYK